MSDKRQLIHDVRNPLNSIVMNVELARMLLQQPSVDQEKLLQLLDVVLSECSKCEEVLDQHRQQ